MPITPYFRRTVTSVFLASLALSSTPAIAHAEPVTKNKPSIPSSPTDMSLPEGEQRYIVKYDNDVNSKEESEALKEKGVKVKETLSHTMKASVVVASSKEIESIKKSEDVVSVEIDQPISISGATDVWGLDRVDQRTGRNGQYNVTDEGSGVNVYVIDTGLYMSHNEFAGRVPASWSGINDGKGVHDCNGHGTHVAGTVAGTTYGVAKKANIIPLRALECDGRGWSSTAAAAIDWAVAHHTAGQPAVLNMSIGGFSSASFDQAVQKAVDDGITVVAAAGNSNVDACEASPAKVPAAITVAATDVNDTQASFSNYGSCVDIQAPGVAIRSAYNNAPTGYNTMSGTSMATPHVAGAAAVFLSRNGALSPAQVTQSILNNATNNVVKGNKGSTPNKMLYVPAPAFTDLAGNGFVKEITWMKDKGISTGYADGTYRPYDNVSREAMAAFMYRMSGSPSYVAPAVSPFVDVPTNHHFYKEIAWMNSAGISTGWADGTYRPYDNVSREAMSAFMQRYSNKVCSVNVQASREFTDAHTSGFATQIRWMGGAGISTGYADGTYRPFDAVTREAMAAFMYRLNSHIDANGGCKN